MYIYPFSVTSFTLLSPNYLTIYQWNKRKKGVGDSNIHKNTGRSVAASPVSGSCRLKKRSELECLSLGDKNAHSEYQNACCSPLTTGILAG